MTTKPLAEWKQGDAVSWQHQVTKDEVDAFARLSGDCNPLHIDDAFARARGFRGRVVHGALVTAYISRILGTALPGAGCLWVSQTIRFVKPVYIADVIDVNVRVLHKSDPLRMLVLETMVKNPTGEVLLSGEAKVILPRVPGDIAQSDTMGIVAPAEELQAATPRDVVQ
jgi:acyl dehydratase